MSVRSIVRGITVVAAVIAGGSGTAAAERPDASNGYIVILARDAIGGTPGSRAPAGESLDRARAARIERTVAALGSDHGFRAAHVFRWAVEGFAAQLTDRQVRALVGHPSVAHIQPDAVTRLDDGGEASSDGIAAAEVVTLGQPVVPTGIRRVRADQSSVARIDGIDERVDADVAIIDTGIESSHPDLDVVGGHDCTGSAGGWGRDGNGHGTHVAGTVAALDDDLGVVGVAPGARLWSVKVLDANGTGLVSWWICGIDWVTGMLDPDDGTRPLIEVANMSLRGPLQDLDDRDCGYASRDFLHRAICASVANGTVYAVAAGNDIANARRYRPAAYDEVITVSALADFDGRPGGVGSQASVCPFFARDRDDTFADFSNFGADVDLIASGKCILSTWRGGRYAWLSGTSMATPAVAGVAALYRTLHPAASPADVRQALRDAATLDWDTRTDPDGTPDRLLDAAAFPDFSIAATRPDDLQAGDLSSFAIDVTRTNGHGAPVTLRLEGIPPGVTATLGEAETLGSRVTVDLAAAADAASGRYDLRVIGTDGSVTRTNATGLVVEGSGPRVDVVFPDEATVAMKAADPVAIAWTEQDPAASGIATRTIQHQESPVRAPATCASATWVDAGPETALDTTEYEASGLSSRRCHRWVIRLTDGAGIATRWVSGAVLLDASPPDAPSVVASGPSVWQAARNDRVFFRPDVGGDVTLTASGNDDTSGIAADLFGELSSADGWTHTPTEGADPFSATLSWSVGAASTTVPARSRNGAGTEGPARVVEIVPDPSPPNGVTWNEPAAGATGWVPTNAVLSWNAGTDAGSGVAAKQSLQRQRATPTASGTCEDPAWVADGEAVSTAAPYEAVGLADGTCYRWLLISRDRVGNARAAVASGIVKVDSTAPTITSPSAGLPVRGRVSASGGVPVRLRWTASDDGSRGVESELRRRDGTATTRVATTSGTASTVSMAPSRASTTWGVRATDLAGNRTDWAEAAPFRLRLLQATASNVGWAGAWRQRSMKRASGGKLYSATAAGASATFRFTGLGVAWVTTVGPDRGAARVSVDGEHIATVDLAAASTSTRRMMLFADWPTEGQHALTIRVEGTVGRQRIDVDAFVVMRAG